MICWVGYRQWTSMFPHHHSTTRVANGYHEKCLPAVSHSGTTSAHVAPDGQVHTHKKSSSKTVKVASHQCTQSTCGKTTIATQVTVCWTQRSLKSRTWVAFVRHARRASVLQWQAGSMSQPKQLTHICYSANRCCSTDRHTHSTNIHASFFFYTIKEICRFVHCSSLLGIQVMHVSRLDRLLSSFQNSLYRINAALLKVILMIRYLRRHVCSLCWTTSGKVRHPVVDVGCPPWRGCNWHSRAWGTLLFYLFLISPSKTSPGIWKSESNSDVPHGTQLDSLSNTTSEWHQTVQSLKLTQSRVTLIR